MHAIPSLDFFDSLRFAFDVGTFLARGRNLAARTGSSWWGFDLAGQRIHVTGDHDLGLEVVHNVDLRFYKPDKLRMFLGSHTPVACEGAKHQVLRAVMLDGAQWLRGMRWPLMLRPPRKDPAPFLRAELEDREPPFNVVPLVHRAALRWTLAEMMAEAPEPAREEALRAAETFLYCADTFALVAPFARAIVPKWWWVGPARRGLVRALGFEAGQTHPWLADLAVNMLIGLDNAVALACHELLFAKHQRFHKHSPPVPLLLRQAERPVVIGGGEPSHRRLELRAGDAVAVDAAEARLMFGHGRHECPGAAAAMVLSNVLAPLVYNDLQLEPDGVREGTRIAEARAEFGRTRLTEGLRRLVLVAAER